MLFQMLEILYPRRCAVCDEIEVTGKGICPLCKDKVHVAGEPAYSLLFPYLKRYIEFLIPPS